MLLRTCCNAEHEQRQLFSSFLALRIKVGSALDDDNQPSLSDVVFLTRRHSLRSSFLTFPIEIADIFVRCCPLLLLKHLPFDRQNIYSTRAWPIASNHQSANTEQQHWIILVDIHPHLSRRKQMKKKSLNILVHSLSQCESFRRGWRLLSTTKQTNSITEFSCICT